MLSQPLSGLVSAKLSRSHLWAVWDTVRDTAKAKPNGRGRWAAYDQTMADEHERRAWTSDEVRREEEAQRARVRRDAARGITKNLENAVAHTEFAKRFAEAFGPARRA